jgi:hypothetical protein
VAIVPVVESWLQAGEANLRWAAAHMSYPFTNLVILGDTVETESGDDISGDIHAYIASNRVAISGPTRKILFVVMKSLKVVGTECLINLSGNAVNLNVGGTANSNIGTATHNPQDASAVFYAWFTQANFANDIPIWTQVLNRCKRFLGNEDDFRECLKIAADCYAIHYPLPRKFGTNGCAFNFWYNENGDPYTDPTDVESYGVDELDDYLRLGTTATGATRVGFNAIRAGAGTVWTIKGVDPIMEIALMGKYIVFQNPIPKNLLGGNTYSLSSFSAMYNSQIALFTDLLCERLHLKEGNILDPSERVNDNNAMSDLARLHKEVDKALLHNSGLKLSGLMYRNNRIDRDYTDLVGPGSEISLVRISKWWLSILFDTEDWSNAKDYLDLQAFNYKVIDIEQTYFDQICESDLKFQLDKDIQTSLRKIGLQGFMLNGHEDWDAYLYASLEGQNPKQYCVAFNRPTDGNALQRTGMLLWSGTFDDNIMDLPMPNAPLGRNSDRGNELTYLHITGRRKLLVSYSSMKPMIWNCGKKKVNLKYGTFDTSKRVGEDLLDQIDF